MSERHATQYINPEASKAYVQAVGGIYPELLANTDIQDVQLTGIKRDALRPIKTVEASREYAMANFIRQGKSMVVVSILHPNDRARADMSTHALAYVAFREVKGSRFGYMDTVHEITDAYTRDTSDKIGNGVDLQDQGQMATLLHNAARRMSPASFIQLRQIPDLGEVHNRAILETAKNLALCERVEGYGETSVFLSSHPVSRDVLIDVLEERYPWLAEAVELGVHSEDSVAPDLQPINKGRVLVPPFVFAQKQAERAARLASGQN